MKLRFLYHCPNCRLDARLSVLVERPACVACVGPMTITDTGGDHDRS